MKLFQIYSTCEQVSKNASIYENVKVLTIVYIETKKLICYFKSTQISSESCVDDFYNNSVNLIILLIETESSIMWGL